MKFTQLIFFLVIISSNIHAFVHIRPVPSLPMIFDPGKAIDVFSRGLITQIHRTLFKMTTTNIPVPSIVKNFNVSKDQKYYTIIFNDLKFHNGEILKFSDIKYSFERILKNKIVGYEKLINIKGAKNFISKKSRILTGIKKGERHNEFHIILNKKTPTLIFDLTSFYFSILQKKSPPSIGLGQYKLTKTNNKVVEIKCVSECNTMSPNRVQYIKQSLSSALIGFKRGDFQDLFDYSINEKLANEFRSIANVQHIFTPKTYLFALNAKKYRIKGVRKRIFQQFNRKSLIKNCYSGNKISSSLIPPGYLGYLSETKANKYNKTLYNKEIHVDIVKGVGNEECVKKNLERYGSKIFVKIVNINVALKNWKSGKNDLIFIYLESEATLDYFQFFNPKAEFSLGLPNDNEIIQKLNNLSIETQPQKKNSAALSIVKHINKKFIILPLFHPREFLIYDKKYKKLFPGIKAKTLIPFQSLKKR